MTFNPKFALPLLIMYGLILSASTVAQQSSSQTQRYFAVAYSNCSEIKRIPLTAEQIEQWQHIQNIQNRMQDIHAPLKAVEKEAQKIGKQIKTITQDAVSLKDGKYTIDRHTVLQQETLATQIDQLMVFHEQDFQQLVILASEISGLAEEFESSISASFADVDVRHIAIIDAAKHNETWHCSSDSALM